MKYIVVDIDGTVADSRHRSHHIQLSVGNRVKDGKGVEGTITHVDHHSGLQTMFDIAWDDDTVGTFPHSVIEGWGNVDFDAWDRDALGDTLIEPTAMVLGGLRAAYSPVVKFLFLTARGEGGRPETEQWLTEKRLFNPDHGDILLMRERGNMEKDTIIKPRILREFIREGHEILFAFDDRGLVTKAFRDMGIFVFHVADYD